MTSANVSSNLDITSLSDFLTTVDVGRVRLVARVKGAFDRFDVDKDGRMDMFEVRECRV